MKYETVSIKHNTNSNRTYTLTLCNNVIIDSIIPDIPIGLTFPSYVIVGSNWRVINRMSCGEYKALQYLFNVMDYQVFKDFSKLEVTESGMVNIKDKFYYVDIEGNAITLSEEKDLNQDYVRLVFMANLHQYKLWRELCLTTTK